MQTVHCFPAEWRARNRAEHLSPWLAVALILGGLVLAVGSVPALILGMPAYGLAWGALCLLAQVGAWGVVFWAARDFESFIALRSIGAI